MTTKAYAIDALPELPLELFEMAGKLKHAGNAPVLTIIPDTVDPLRRQSPRQKSRLGKPIGGNI
jgi:hypothetical protein